MKTRSYSVITFVVVLLFVTAAICSDEDPGGTITLSAGQSATLGDIWNGANAIIAVWGVVNTDGLNPSENAYSLAPNMGVGIPRQDGGQYRSLTGTVSWSGGQSHDFEVIHNCPGYPYYPHITCIHGSLTPGDPEPE